MFMLKRRSTIRRQEKRKPTHGGPYLHVKRRASAKRRAGHHQKPLPETHGHKLRRVTLVLPPPSIRGQFAATRPPPHHPPSTHPPPPLLSCAQAHGRRLLSVHCSWQAEGTPPVQPSQPTQVPPPVPSQLFPPPPPPRPPPSHGAPVRRQDGKRNRRAHRRPCRDPRATAPPIIQGPIAERGHPHVPAPPAPRPPNPTRPAPATAAASRTRRRPSTADACRNTCPAAPGATRNVGRTSGEDQRAHCPSDTNKLRILCPHGDELGSGLCRLTARSGPTVRKGSYITPFPYRPVRFHACLVRPAPW